MGWGGVMVHLWIPLSHESGSEPCYVLLSESCRCLYGRAGLIQDILPSESSLDDSDKTLSEDDSIPELCRFSGSSRSCPSH